MHGLINRSLEAFLTDSYGPDCWARIADAAGLDGASFEAMLTYPDKITLHVLDAAIQDLGKPRDVLLEDVGTYLVSHPNMQPLRRLLRFAGTDYVDFLHSLENLPDRARLAVPDLELPDIQVDDLPDHRFSIHLSAARDIFGHVFLGILSAMADDYGVLALLDHTHLSEGREQITVSVVDAAFSGGRSFSLAAPGDDRLVAE